MDHWLYSIRENKYVFACYMGRQRLGTHVDLAVAAFSRGSAWLCCSRCDHRNAAGAEMVKTNIWKWLIYGI